MRTYGTVTFVPPAMRARHATWRITGEPHVMIRLKRVFPRAKTTRAPGLVLGDSPEVARDLEWVLDRWPMTVDALSADVLAARASAYRDTEDAVARILDGDRPTYPGRYTVPARPGRDYQVLAADMALATGRLLLLDEVGLGKSMSGLLVLREPAALPALVVCQTHLPSQWLRELRLTWPELRGHVITTGPVYNPADLCGGTDPDVLIVSYSKLTKWVDHLAEAVSTVIFDEIQELRRADSLKYDAAARIAGHAAYRLGLSNSPAYNWGIEFYNVLDVVAPGVLGQREEFLREWGGEDGKRLRTPRVFGAWLREQGLTLHRTRRDVGRELPPVTRAAQTVDADTGVYKKLTSDAVQVARLILASTTPHTERWRAAGDLDWKMRQATGIAKAPYVAAFVRLLLESERKVVLFGWHRAVYGLWLDALSDLNPVLYTGSEAPAQKDEALRAFVDGDARVLVMSLRSGVGVDGLQNAAHVAVFGELDWSPKVHDQCVGRLNRDGMNTDEPVIAYFMLSDHGTDPLMAETLELKDQQTTPVVDPDVDMYAPIPAAGTDRIRLLAETVLTRAGETLPPATGDQPLDLKEAS